MEGSTEAVVLSLVKILKGRGMLSLFTEKYGKISAGAFLREKGGASALRPFAYGSYELRGARNTFYINRADIISSFYHIGEDMGRYANAAFVLEFTGKLLPEEAPAPKLFALLLEFLRLMEGRGKDFDTPVLAYMAKALKLWGAAPELEFCGICGEHVERPVWLSVKDGGALCGGCAGKSAGQLEYGREKLLYKVNFDIVNVMRYLMEHPMEGFEGLSLEGGMARALRSLLRSHASYHLDIARLKTEGVLDGLV